MPFKNAGSFIEVPDYDLRATGDITFTSMDGNITLQAIPPDGAILISGPQVSVNGGPLSAKNAHFSQIGVTGTNKGDAAFSDYPDSPTVTINKTMNSALTNIRVRFEPGFYIDGGGASVEFAVETGGTDYVTRRIGATMSVLAHQVGPGTVDIEGLSAGLHTIVGRWRNPNAVDNVAADGGDSVTLEAYEVSAENL